MNRIKNMHQRISESWQMNERADKLSLVTGISMVVLSTILYIIKADGVMEIALRYMGFCLAIIGVDILYAVLFTTKYSKKEKKFIKKICIVIAYVLILISAILIPACAISCGINILLEKDKKSISNYIKYPLMSLFCYYILSIPNIALINKGLEFISSKELKVSLLNIDVTALFSFFYC